MGKNTGKPSKMIPKKSVGRPRLTAEEKWERRARKAENLVIAESAAAVKDPTPYQISRVLVARRRLHAVYSEGFASGFLAG